MISAEMRFDRYLMIGVSIDVYLLAFIFKNKVIIINLINKIILSK
jgi:hypothetical protein